MSNTIRRLYITYVASDYKNDTNNYYDIELEMTDPSPSRIKDKIREYTNFWDYGISIVSIIDMDKLARGE